MTALETVLVATAAALLGLAFVFLARGVAGPTVYDRVVAINAVGTTVVVVVVLLAAAFKEPGLLDVAIVYALLNFLLSLGVARFTGERGVTR
ncbi:monovalent cation/H+ antiporter complex subunit F [Halarchaeum sp. P4]|uniref:monovalent cation/H+ antiporter complex subunit F n=1 Tax=Halarchaeum sp. P4 TaxID=3421639 RepID=UPI003EBA503B